MLNALPAGVCGAWPGCCDGRLIRWLGYSLEKPLLGAVGRCVRAHLCQLVPSGVGAGFPAFECGEEFSDLQGKLPGAAVGQMAG